MKAASQGGWAKAPLWILGLGLAGSELRVLLALLGHADPQRSGREVWPSEKRLAGMIGLKPNADGARNVSKAVTRLEKRGCLERRRRPGGPLRVSLKVVLSGKCDRCPACGCFGHIHAQACGRFDHPHVAELATSTEQTTPSVPRQSGGIATEGNGNGQRPQHPQADAYEMRCAWANARARGVTLEDFHGIVDLRPDLSAAEINSAVCKWAERYPCPKRPARSLRGWLEKERGYRGGPGYRVSDDTEPRPGGEWWPSQRDTLRAGAPR